MAKEEMFVFAAIVLAIGMMACSYLLTTIDWAPKVDVSDITSTPNIYVSSTPPEHVLSVSGSVSERITPDLVNIQIRIETQDKNAQQSQQENADVSEQVRTKLEEVGLKEDEMKTTSYRVEPVMNSTRICDSYGCHYDWEIVGYKTVHVLNIRTTELENGGKIIDAAAEAGENEVFVDSVWFDLQDQTRKDLQKSLLKKAGQEAEEKAQSIAEGLGVTLGKVVQASESFYYPMYNQYKSYDYAMAEAAAPVPTDLSPGEIEVSATVSAGYELN